MVNYHGNGATQDIRLLFAFIAFDVFQAAHQETSTIPKGHAETKSQAQVSELTSFIPTAATSCSVIQSLHSFDSFHSHLWKYALLAGIKEAFPRGRQRTCPRNTTSRQQKTRDKQ
jgi:hypothetical protein